MKKYHSFTDHTCSIDTIEILTQELDRINFDVNPLELCLSSARKPGENKEEIKALAQYLNAQPPYRKGYVYENLEQGKELPPPSEIEAPRFELKPLLSQLKYEFLDENKTLPVIGSGYLADGKLNKLLRVLRKHMKAIR